MARVLDHPQEAKIPQRNNFAWVLALFVPHLGYAGGAASLLVPIAVIGILAAVAFRLTRTTPSERRLLARWRKGTPPRPRLVITTIEPSCFRQTWKPQAIHRPVRPTVQ